MEVKPTKSTAKCEPTLKDASGMTKIESPKKTNETDKEAIKEKRIAKNTKMIRNADEKVGGRKEKRVGIEKGNMKENARKNKSEEKVKERVGKTIDEIEQKDIIPIKFKIMQKGKEISEDNEKVLPNKQPNPGKNGGALTKGRGRPKKPTSSTKPSTKSDRDRDRGQSTLTQYFQVRRSARKPKVVAEKEKKKALEQKILSGNEDGLEIRILEGKGRGIFSKTPLKRGDLVCEYAGDLINIDEAKRREKQYAENPEVGCYMYYFLYSGKKYCVDATKESDRLGRLLNHSKTNANVCTRLFPINNVPHLILIAAKDLDKDEELLYDYGDRSKSAVESHPWLKS